MGALFERKKSCLGILRHYVKHILQLRDIFDKLNLNKKKNIYNGYTNQNDSS